jgi:hypothetical protein
MHARSDKSPRSSVYPPPDNRARPAADRRFGMVKVAWIVVSVLIGIGALYFLLLFQWHADRPTQGGNAPVTPVLSVVLDYLFAAWLSFPLLLFVALFFAAVVTWRAFFASRKMALGRVRRGALVFAGLIAALGAVAIAALKLPSLLAGSVRAAFCETTTFEQSVSPNGRYQASVIQVDCGAMSNFNRQVIVTRIPFGWASQSIMFFNGQPTVHLSWNGRLLIIQGQESPKSMRHPPPDPMVWGGIMARYMGPEN